MFCSIVIVLIILVIVLLGILLTKMMFKKSTFDSSWNNKSKAEIKKLLSSLCGSMYKGGIKIVPAYGSLLGWARHNKQTIPWDDDMDVLIDDKDRKKFEKILDESKDLECFKYSENMYKIFLKDGSYRSKASMADRFLDFFEKSEKKIDVDGYYKWKWPFVDVFFYKSKFIEDEGVYEIDPFIDTHAKWLRLKKYKLPNDMQTFRDTFEGVEMDIPVDYKLILEQEFSKTWKDVCISSEYDHRKERIIFDKRLVEKCEDVKM